MTDTTTTHQEPGPLGAGPVRINPTSWSAGLGYDQGQLRAFPRQLLTVAGQGSLDEHGRCSTRATSPRSSR